MAPWALAIAVVAVAATYLAARLKAAGYRVRTQGFRVPL